MKREDPEMKNKLIRAKRLLEKYKQKHVLSFYEKLPKEKKRALADQITAIDFEELQRLYKLAKKEVEIDLEELEPVNSLNPARFPKDELQEYTKIGEEVVKSEKFAVVTMAGGQRNKIMWKW